MPFANQLKKWRAKCALSQSAAAGVLGLPVRTLQEYEQARSSPRELARETLCHRMEMFEMIDHKPKAKTKG